MIQVYYSKMTDLLLSKKDKFRILIITKDAEAKVIVVKGATMVPVNFTDAEELKRVYCQGLDNREMRSTFVNETSSRSHLIFSIYIE